MWRAILEIGPVAEMPVGHRRGVLRIHDIRITCRTCYKSKPEAPTPRDSDCMSQSIILPNSRCGSEADGWEPFLEKC